jgi:hypothetical protein
VGNSLTDTAAGPSREQFSWEETRDFRHDGTGVGFRLNSPDKFVDANGSLLVSFVLVVSTLLDRGLRLSGTAVLRGLPIINAKTIPRAKMDGCISAPPWDGQAQIQSSFHERVVFQRLPNVTHQGDRFVFRR